MKRIHYANGSIVTGDAIADVLIRYAAALAVNDTAAEVTAPALAQTGETTEVVMLLGPASQILAEDAPGAQELVDAEFVRVYEEKLAALGPTRAGFVRGGTDESDDLDLDYL